MELVHPVGQADATVLVGGEVVPAGPDFFAFRHEARVGVEVGFVGGVGEGAEDFGFFVACVGKHFEGLVAVGGDDDVVEYVCFVF